MLYLKKIEIYGFKSFADKLEIKFTNPVTAIVGPNGCGKSNISDAVRWVLGEQSARILRGKSMTDLIFSGTDQRKSMSYCEVSLFLDNADRHFPLDMNEIIITRKLYRTNESEYFLNRNLVRLKDITDLLHAVGLGRDGYSIVGQGRMDAVLSAKPEDRRAIFEEALGISQFRIRKVETERKLEKTSINMNSLNLILSELERQLEPLKKQAATAQKYLDLAERLKLREINAYIYGYDNASAQKKSAKEIIDNLKTEYNVEEKRYVDLSEEHETLLNDINNLDVTLTQLRDRQMSLAVEIERQTGAQSLLKEKIRNAEAQTKNLEASAIDDEDEIQVAFARIAETQSSLTKRKAEKESLEKEVLALTDDYTKISAICDDLQKGLDTIQNEYTEFIRNETHAKTSQVVNETKKRDYLARLSQINDTEVEINERIRQLSNDEASLMDGFEADKKQKGEIVLKIENGKNVIDKLRSELTSRKSSVSVLQQKIASENGKLSALKDFVDSYKGYGQSVQRLMKDRKQNATLSSAIIDVVANVLRVDEKHRASIGGALNERLQDVVVRDSDDVKYVVDYLKYNQYGRITLLPLKNLKKASRPSQNVAQEKGFVAFARDQVTCDDEFLPVADALLGDVVICEDFVSAMSMSKKFSDAVFVTADGEKIMRDGAVCGGSAQRNQTGLLSYESEIQAKTTEIEKLKTRLDEEIEIQRTADDTLTRTQDVLTAHTTTLHELNVRLATAREKIDASQNLSVKDKRTLSEIAAERAEIQKQIAVLSDENEQTKEVLTQSIEKETTYSEQILQLKEKLKVQNEQKATFTNDLSSKKYRLGVLNINIDNGSHSIYADKNRIQTLQNNLKNKNTTLTTTRNDLQTYYAQLASVSINDANNSELNEIVEKVKSQDSLKADLNKRFDDVGNLRLTLSTKLEGLKGSIDKQEYILGKIDDDLSVLQLHIEEDYHMSYSEAMQFKEENYDDEASKQELTHLKNAIARLGYVNVNAISDFQDVSTRFDDITAQVDDLKKAQSDLNSVLINLTKEIEHRFETGLENINNNFKAVFCELFNGGNAQLVLDKDENKAPLDYGIEIVAQPPGKRLQSISLLSGGERTLTAAAILFAILKLNPLPFCVLDEIEAALDDANADRIARYIKKFSDDTQFVVITHKKPTMENADVLYGVTMEEKGVSKVVSVKLTEAVKQAA